MQWARMASIAPTPRPKTAAEPENEPRDFESQTSPKSLKNIELSETQASLENTSSQTRTKSIAPESAPPDHSGAAARRGIEPSRPAWTGRKNEPSDFESIRAAKSLPNMELSETNPISATTNYQARRRSIEPESAPPDHSGAAARRGIEPSRPGRTEPENEPAHKTIKSAPMPLITNALRQIKPAAAHSKNAIQWSPAPQCRRIELSGLVAHPDRAPTF